MEKKAAVLQANVCKKYGITREELKKGVEHYSSLATGKFCGDMQVLLAIIELLTAGDIGDEEKTEPIGKVIKGCYRLSQYIGEGKTENGKEFKSEASLRYEPIVAFGDSYFLLSWQDVVKLAEQAGLFADEQ